MKDNSDLKKGWIYRFGRFILFLICGLLLFFVSVTFSDMISKNTAVILRIGLTIAFLACALLLRRNERLKKYWLVFFAFSVATFVQFLSWHFSDLPLRFLNLTVNTADGIAVAKLSSTVLIVIPIIVLTLIAGGNMDSIYLKKGKLRLGLIIGLTSFIVLTALAVMQTLSQNISLERIIPVTPWILVFIFSNGLNEELLFRGLFLKKLEPLLGRNLSNLMMAIILTSTHIKVTYTPDLLIFLIIVFALALVWGYVMQKTDSLLASALFHAGADTLIIMAIFATYGVGL